MIAAVDNNNGQQWTTICGATRMHACNFYIIPESSFTFNRSWAPKLLVIIVILIWRPVKTTADGSDHFARSSLLPTRNSRQIVNINVINISIINIININIINISNADSASSTSLLPTRNSRQIVSIVVTSHSWLAPLECAFEMCFTTASASLLPRVTLLPQHCQHRCSFSLH